MTFRNWRDATKILEKAQIEIGVEITQRTRKVEQGIFISIDTFDLDLAHAILDAALRHLHIEYLDQLRHQAAGKYVDAIFHRTRNL